MLLAARAPLKRGSADMEKPRSAALRGFPLSVDATQLLRRLRVS